MKIAVRVLLVACVSLAFAAGCGEKPQTGGVTDGGGGGGDGTDAGETTDAGPGPAVTWYRDVLPIVQKNCQGCHVPGGIAPFPLMTYQDAASRHDLIAQQVVTRAMPPWMPDDSCIAIQNSRRLSNADIDVFDIWNGLGAPAGDPKDAPPPPSEQPGLPWVDATLDTGVDYTPDATVSDDYRCFIVPPAFAAQTDIIGFDLIPGQPKQVHHAILFDVPQADAQALDDGEPGPGWTCYGGPGVAQNQVVMIGGWVPGNGATTLPEDTGIRVPAGHVIVMQIHYNTANGVAPDRSSVKLQYAKSPVPKPAKIFPVVADTFSIPPNSMGYSASTQFSLAGVGAPAFITQATVYGTTPHMHQLGASIRAKKLGTNGAADTCMIDVPKWDFHWQQSYKYTTPVVVKRDDVIQVTCSWNNPTNRTVTWGEGTSDEMCVAFFYVTLP